MLDEFAQRLISEARTPSQLSGADTRDMISQSYLSWLAQTVFGVEVNGNSVPKDVLRRLSLAASIIDAPENVDIPNIGATAFLVAESAEISSMFIQYDQEELPLRSRFRRIVRYLDLASYYHLADYDANANVMAKTAFGLLDRDDFNVDGVVDDSRVSYYRCLGYFLRGKFSDCRDEANKEIRSSTSEERCFRFLRVCLVNLTRKYQEQGDDEVDIRLENLRLALQDNSVSYFALQAETSRLIEFYSAVSRKSLYQILVREFADQQEYLNARISGDKNQGYPFAWPPTRDFCEKYFVRSLPHAVITVPTGGGKSFLAELALVDALRRGWVLYMAPTNALCSQIKADIKQNLASLTNVDVEVYLGELEYSAELPKFQMPRQVLVVTPEKALLLLKRQPELFGGCSAAVLDECHLLASKNRGDIAEIVLAFCLSQNAEVRIILMSALVQNNDKLADWLENKTGRQVAKIDLNWKPTRIARLTVLPDWSTLETYTNGQKSSYSIGVRIFGDTVTPWEVNTPLESWLTPIRLSHSSQTFPWVNEVTRNLAASFVAKNIPTLVFVIKNRHHAFSIAEKIDFDLPPSERPQISQKEIDLIALALYELGTTTLLEQLIHEKGAAVHTSTMLSCEREVSEIAFESGRALLLIATGTLSQGLNLAAKAVIVCGTKLPDFEDRLDNDPNELRDRSLTQVLNAIGRAARANISCRGTSIIVPDTLPNTGQDTTKNRILQLVPELRYKDASLQVTSPIMIKFQAVLANSVDADANEIERSLLSLLPIESESLGATVSFTLGSFELTDNETTQAIIRRLEAIKSKAIEDGNKEWVMKAASLAGIQYELATNLYTFIITCAGKTDFEPPNDSYHGWASFLLGWLQQLPAYATWDLLRLHIKAWRYSWGNEKDPDVGKLFEEAGYPEVETTDVQAYREHLWENIQITVQAWLDDEALVRIGERLIRRESTETNQNKRTSAGHLIPRTITWTRGFIEHFSQFAGLLLAIQNQWVENEPNSIPDWFLNTNSLHTFPIGLRYGVRDPFSAAWYRHIIQERRAANLLQNIAPLQSEIVVDLQDAWSETRDSLSKFLQIDNGGEEEIITVLRRLLSSAG